jgi:hypothetical protein
VQNYLSVHSASEVFVSSYNPDNSRAVIMMIRGESGGLMEVSIYGLPEDRAEVMLLALRHEKTTVWTDGVTMSVDQYMETKDIYRALKGEKQEEEGVPF